MSPTVKKNMPNWQTSLKNDMIWKYRQATWWHRCLPDFIIIGAQKSGTSSMYSYLSQHPQIFPPFTKEIHFFDGGLNPSIDNFEKGKSWYGAHFPLRRNISANQKTFEASPLYIFNPLAPQRIAHLFPKVKIIALLRNPTERTISHYFHSKRREREPLEIYEALQQEESRLAPAIEAKDYKSEVFIYNSYKHRGLYKEQLERYFKYFSREQILVMCSEEFFAEPDICLRQIFEFVGVDPEYKVANMKPQNVAKNRESVAPNIYDYLDSFFQSHNQELYEILGTHYDW